MIVELKNTELIEINGGHHGSAYNAGAAVDDFITKAGFVCGLVALFFMPKS